MTVRLDPEGTEIKAIRNLVDFNDRRVLEVGCGDGRLTWRYAEEPSHVLAIDPDQERIMEARSECPPSLKDKVEFEVSTLQDRPFRTGQSAWDIVLLSWSL